MSAKRQADVVTCPVCQRSVPAAEINLHLDLRCPGLPAAGPSSPLQASGTQRSLVETSQPETPATRNNAPMFRSRPASQSNGKAGVKRPAPPDPAREDKKPRINALKAAQPLAERSRPTSLSEYVGQGDLVGPGSLLRARIEAGEGVGSCILWGPPGSGKTTLARLIARNANADFRELSATSSGTADVRQVFEQAKNGLSLTGRKTILMVDEIHRFTRPQQDLFLPYVENGWVQLIGATTENPSFKVNGALLSRCQVFTLAKHTPEDLEQILNNALKAVPDPPRLPAALIPFLSEAADGDARQALNGFELALQVCAMPVQTTLDEEADLEAASAKRDGQLMEAVRRGLRKGYNRSGDERYDMISAMHKSIRGSDGSAAMYWLARMLEGGEDPLYIARRLVVVASEDVGLANNEALPLAIAAYQACQFIGMPECRINLAHLVAYLSESPKSTRSYTAYNRAAQLAHQTPLPPVPLQICNAPTKVMKQLGYGRDYAYNPNYAHPVTNDYLPRELQKNSSLLPAPTTQSILRVPSAEEEDKMWDEGKLKEWELDCNGGVPWPGRAVRDAKLMRGESVHRDSQERRDAPPTSPEVDRRPVSESVKDE
ncbi:P-loop containing nucleoside triphosphate hydrolase protein [Cutaneotrichosporon oleaginosum]|uniref:p-loop containing nucleoside triphosphate hydrolase protein n=1 Tax=Cutaneotrichosporon oleaginosum TaxID=879819 RepID=A0A0J0XQ02_9TREE|nr:P-loop containing nucleoside triphosphate hydrolase protein [Cutaneotrichosporon oleaginosum]KLT43152.1 P-loop containing nucleoside triphosphate hydrolase protein [Cutaneotrichosporon oleaginosum]TXT10078.1 hypothetical protein COLE_04012 [Cutaneotrichosporon oleaginosum]